MTDFGEKDLAPPSVRNLPRSQISFGNEVKIIASCSRGMAPREPGQQVVRATRRLRPPIQPRVEGEDLSGNMIEPGQERDGARRIPDRIEAPKRMFRPHLFAALR